MRKKVSERWLQDAISAHMAAQPIGPGVWWAKPVRCDRVGNGPNWKHCFEGDVPAGYAEGWDRTRHQFEDAYDMADRTL